MVGLNVGMLDLPPTRFSASRRGAIMLASLIWDISEFGFDMAQLFYVLELLMFVAAYFFVNTKEGKSWYSAKNL